MSQSAQPGPAATVPPDSTPPPVLPSATTPATAATAPVGGVLSDRGSGFRPYPTASTSTRLSPASPASRAAARRRRVGTPIPATVWVPEPGGVVDPAAVWPTVILGQIVSAFSRPGDEVVLTPWPSDTSAVPKRRTRTPGVTQDGPARGAVDGDLDSALDTVARLHRCPRIVELGPASATVPARERPDARPTDDETRLPRGGTAQLVVTSMPPHPTGARHTDAVALHAARELCFGGILVVLTHCDSDGGELRDPTGPMIAAAQNADLLYLQHIVAVHLPVPDLRAPTTTGPTSAPAASAVGSSRTGTRHALAGSAQPDSGARAAHRRVHSDVLAFAQPHEHRSPQPVNPDNQIPW